MNKLLKGLFIASIGAYTGFVTTRVLYPMPDDIVINAKKISKVYQTYTIKYDSNEVKMGTDNGHIDRLHKTITFYPQSLIKDNIETVIHEAIHATYPFATEKTVDYITKKALEYGDSRQTAISIANNFPDPAITFSKIDLAKIKDNQIIHQAKNR